MLNLISSISLLESLRRFNFFHYGAGSIDHFLSSPDRDSLPFFCSRSSLRLARMLLIGGLSSIAQASTSARITGSLIGAISTAFD